jgi:hypothetical protein
MAFAAHRMRRRAVSLGLANKAETTEGFVASRSAIDDDIFKEHHKSPPAPPGGNLWASF